LNMSASIWHSNIPIGLEARKRIAPKWCFITPKWGIPLLNRFH